MTEEQWKITNRLLERIAIALERNSEKERAKAPASNPIKKTQAVTPTTTEGQKINVLIKCYIDSYKARYGQAARPDVSGRVQGLMKTLFRDYSLEKMTAIVQAFLQMDDEWFKKKAHDFPTLYENIGKVQTALNNGTGRAEDQSFWNKVQEKANGLPQDVQTPDRKIAGELRRPSLQGGASRALLEGPTGDA